MGLEEALTELEDVDPKEFASALEDQRSPFFKAIRNPAYKEGKAEGEKEAESAREAVAALRKEKQKLETRLEEMEGEQPEVAELRGKYEAKLEDLQKQIQDKDQQVEKVRKETQETLRQREEAFFKQQAKNWLITEGRVEDPDMAEVKIEKAFMDGRVQFDDEAKPRIYEPGGEVPTPLGDKKPHEVFGESILESIDTKYITDPRPSSTGVDGFTGGTGKKMSRKQFDRLPPAEQKEFAMGGGQVVD